MCESLRPGLLVRVGPGVCRDLRHRPDQDRAHDPPGLPSQLEAAAYFVVAGGLTNAQKHAGASRVVVQVLTDNGDLVVDVLDDGGGGAGLARSGLRGLSDRVEALGGSLTLESPPRGGTRLLARIPLGGASR